MTEQQKTEFEQLSGQLIKWLNDNRHPHHTIVITPTSAELSEGVVGFTTDKHIID